MTEDEALRRYGTAWWRTVTDEELVRFQLFEARLCMPFGTFHAALERVLNRPVFAHEIGLCLPKLKEEFNTKFPPREVL